MKRSARSYRAAQTRRERREDLASAFQSGGCRWFAGCDRQATQTRRGPIGDGRFGEIPVCDRCAAFVDGAS